MEESSPWNANNLWETQLVFIYTVAEEVTEVRRELIIISKLHCGAIISFKLRTKYSSTTKSHHS